MLAGSALALAAPAAAQGPIAPNPAAPDGIANRPLSWTDWADLALASPVVIVGVVCDTDRLGRRDAPDVPSGEVRALVHVNLRAALKAPSVLPAGAAWRWQGRADGRGRPPFGKGTTVLAFARQLPGGADPAVLPLSLVAPHAQQPWSAAAEAQLRAILAQALEPGATGLMVTGLRDAFRSVADLPGESESQFFLVTEAGGALTLVVRRQPGADPVVLVATGDVVAGAMPVARQTLLWRALACGMPERLPDGLGADADLALDYAAARQRIGACDRTPGL
jgi:hypothetical protein